MATYVLDLTGDWPSQLNRMLRKASDGDTLYVRTQAQSTIATARLKTRHPDKNVRIIVGLPTETPERE